VERGWRQSIVVACGLTLVAGLAACTPPPPYLPPIDWVALGDSYSAGTGLGLPALDCDRDSGSYPDRAALQLAAQQKIALRSFRTVACSGAATSSYWSGQGLLTGARVAAQQAAITRDADVVTMTLGGNDIGFTSKVVGCVLGECGADVWSVSPGAGLTWDGLRQRLVDVFVDVRRRMSPAGHVFVLTYPAPFALDAAACPGGPLTFTLAEQRAANALATRLGDTIAAAVTMAGQVAGNVHLVDWRLGPRVDGGHVVPAGRPGAGQAFALHRPADGLCNARGLPPVLNNLSFPPTSNTYHPNATGYAQAANLLVPRVAAALGV
jgi:lysophospholipase L1-like esterase